MAVSAGWWHSCGLRTDNTLVCWGHNEDYYAGQAEAQVESSRRLTGSSEITGECESPRVW